MKIFLPVFSALLICFSSALGEDNPPKPGQETSARDSLPLPHVRNNRLIHPNPKRLRYVSQIDFHQPSYGPLEDGVFFTDQDLKNRAKTLSPTPDKQH